jgi:hypothetical protein
MSVSVSVSVSVSASVSVSVSRSEAASSLWQMQGAKPREQGPLLTQHVTVDTNKTSMLISKPLHTVGAIAAAESPQGARLERLSLLE